MDAVEVKNQSSRSIMELKPSCSFVHRDGGAIGISALPSFSSKDLSAMISAWVDQSNDEYVREMTISSGKNFKNIALQQHLSKQSCDQQIDPENMLKAPFPNPEAVLDAHLFDDMSDPLERKSLKRTCEELFTSMSSNKISRYFPLLWI
jgi:hypothetical protein